MKMEIREPLNLSDREEALLAAHSFYNILHIVVMELDFLRRVFGAPDAFGESGLICRKLLQAFEDRDETIRAAREIENYRRTIEGELREARTKYNVDEKNLKLVEQSYESLAHVFEVLDMRVREMLARQEARGEWRFFEPVELEGQLRHFFDAVVWNARGRYGIAYAPELQKENDYLVDMRIDGPDGGPLYLPPVLTDTLRDLCANARKYSLPGKAISVTLLDDGNDIVLEVRDNGRGIPENEIADVVRYGIRATNTKPEETHGGGFGLTKAYYVCRQHGGRMWIESDMGQGTTVTLRIPRAAKAA